MESLEEIIHSYSITILTGATLALLILAGISLRLKHLHNAGKKILFLSIVVVILLPTLFLIGSTIYLNMISSSGGPVHWHADFEVWACGKELDLKNPTGLSNKIGTATLHEHNDKRIHMEGVVVEKDDASLARFFHVIGGSLASDALSFQATTGNVSFRSGDTCYGSYPAELQVFVYKVEYGKYYQVKVAKPEAYIMAPEQNVPDGDCIIVEFDRKKEKTDKICRSFAVAEKVGKLQRGN